MKIGFVLLALTSLAVNAEEWVPFHLPWDAPPDAVADARFLLDAPAGKHGFIKVRDGHFWFAGLGRQRFWAVNLMNLKKHVEAKGKKL